MAQVIHRTKRRRRAMAEINVVPYIDVMLVLLIIFMATAPLLNLGVEIQLPQSTARPVEQNQDPILVNIDAKGDLYLTLEGQSELIDLESLGAKVGAFTRRNPDISVLIGADKRIAYGQLYDAMSTLQNAGVVKVGLMSEPKPSR
jgi:biopolymer transport protein TolR